jgi:type VI protein secretion system component Hcp
MSRRILFRLQMALLCLAALGGTYLHAQKMYLCVGSGSTNFQSADFVACGSNASEIQAFSFGASVPVTVGLGGLTTGVTAVSKLSLLKSVGALSTVFESSLFKHVSLGSSLALGVNTVASGGIIQNVTITLSNPKVVGLTQSGSSEQPVESVAISYSAITITDNTATPPTTVTWSGN